MLRRHRIAAALLPSVLACSACTAGRPLPPPPPAPRPPALTEEDVRPVERPRVEVLAVDETAGADGQTVTVSGTLVNRGTGVTREVAVRVHALDAAGAVVRTADTRPVSEIIAPGATTTFFVTMENRPEVRSYHVEVISR